MPEQQTLGAVCPTFKDAEIKTSDKRQSWGTGAVRDNDDKKGSPHLMPGTAMLKWMRGEEEAAEIPEEKTSWDLTWEVQIRFWLAQEAEDWPTAESYLREILVQLSEIARREAEAEGLVSPNRITAAWRRLSLHFQRGAKVYAPNNWRKGMHSTRYFDSGSRHLWDHFDGKDDEDHLAACMWNVQAMLQTHADVIHKRLPEEMDDIPLSWDRIQSEAPPAETSTDTGTYNQNSI